MSRVKNPETHAVEDLRRVVDEVGGWSVKINDRFTIGVPDLFVVVPSIGMMAVEVKQKPTMPNTPTWRQLGLSGAQDQKIRDINAAHRRSAVVAVRTNSGWMVFVPIVVNDTYACIGDLQEWLASPLT